eukprot:30479_1
MSTTRNKYRSLPHFEHNIDLNNQICIIEQCKLYQQLFRLLNEYNSDEYFEDSDSDKMCNILNAFHHVLQFHDSDQQFKQIYDELNKQCKYQSCKIYNRHNIRRRHHHIEDEYKSNQSTYAYTTQHILDKLHSFYLHSYDTLSRLRPSQQFINEDDKIMKLEKIITSSLNKNTFRLMSNKYNTDLSLQESAGNYSFGERFEYEENLSPWFVKSKYQTLKSELLHNKISNITMKIYQSEYNKCMNNINTKRVKLIENGNIHKILRMDHLLCSFIYCNCDMFQTKW